MADKRVGGGGTGKRTGGGQKRTSRGAYGTSMGASGGGAGGARGARGSEGAGRGASGGPRQPNAMKRGGFTPAPDFAKKREAASSGAPRWSDIPEHKSKRGSAKGAAQSQSRGLARGPAQGSDKREASSWRGEAASPRKSNYSGGRGDRPLSRKEGYSGAGRGDRPVSRREASAPRERRGAFGRFKPAPAYEKSVPTDYKTESFPPPPQKLPSESFVSPQAEEGIVAGINPVLELLHSGNRPVDTLYIDKDKGGGQIEQMVALARRKGVQLRIVPRAALDKMAFGVRHQGAVATVPPKEYADAYELAESAVKTGKIPLLVILDGIEDPHNLGAIIRTSEGAGADGVVIPEHRAAHLTSTVSKVSSGALEHMPVAKVSNLANYLEFLKGKGFWTVGLAGDAKETYSRPDLTVPLAVVLGGEEAGIRPVVKNACDMLVSLPMLGKVSSLNVSVAAGVMLYEVLRQRAEKASR